MAISFPLTPSNGQTYTYSGTTYTYDGKRWVATTNTIQQATTNVNTANISPSNPTQGQMWLNTDTGTISVYAMGGWVAIGSVMSTIPAGSITNTMLANSAVTTDTLANSSVTTTKLNDKAVTTAKIANNAVTSQQIANYTITAQQIANNTITSSQLANGAAVPSQTGQSGKYLTTNGTTASWSTISALPSQATNSGKYLTTDGNTASWATVTTTLADGSITTDKLANNAVTATKINQGTDYFPLAIGNTAQRPSSPASGYTRFNSETQALELYFNNTWNALAYALPGLSAANPATSATQLANLGVTLNGNYWINISGTAVQCYVDFALAGGPYILVMVAASTGTAYDYDSTVWTNTSGGVNTALDPTSDTNQVSSAFYNLATTRTGMALYSPSSNYFHYLDHTSGTARAMANSGTPPTAVSPNGTTINANNIIPASSPARALGWWNAITAAGLTAASNGATYYRYGYAHGSPDPVQFGYCRFGWSADLDSSDSRDRGMGMGIKNNGGGPVGVFSASAGRWDYNDGSTAYKNNLKGYLYIKN